MKTLTIAGDERTALSVSNYFAFREVDRRDIDLQHGRLTPERAQDYVITSAYHAYSTLLGQRFGRIIIGGDYLRWNFGPQPGRLTNLWRVICVARARGTKVVFN